MRKCLGISAAIMCLLTINLYAEPTAQTNLQSAAPVQKTFAAGFSCLLSVYTNQFVAILEYPTVTLEWLVWRDAGLSLTVDAIPSILLTYVSGGIRWYPMQPFDQAFVGLNLGVVNTLGITNVNYAVTVAVEGGYRLTYENLFVEPSTRLHLNLFSISGTPGLSYSVYLGLYAGAVF